MHLPPNRFITAAALLLLLALAGPAAAGAQTREPFQSQVSFTIPDGLTTHGRSFRAGNVFESLYDRVCACYYSAARVPAAKRMVIEDVGATAKLPTGQMVEIDVRTSVPLTASDGKVLTNAISHPFVPANKVAGIKDWFVLNQLTRLYAAGGTFIDAIAIRSAGSGVAEINVIISGYLEDDSTSTPTK